MIVRQEFHNDLPPRMYLEQISNTTTQIYMFLWDHKDKNNKLRLTWKSLCKTFNKNSFNTNLRKLGLIGLLDYEETDAGVNIELVGWDEE